MGKRTTIDELPDLANRIRNHLDSFDLSSAFDHCHDIVARDIHGHFRQSHTPDGLSWPERKDDLAHPLLILSGAMMTAAVGEGSAHVWNVSARSMQYGVDTSSIVYAAAQNYGYKQIPPREFLGLSSKGEAECRDIIKRYTLDAMPV